MDHFDVAHNDMNDAADMMHAEVPRADRGGRRLGRSCGVIENTGRSRQPAEPSSTLARCE
jgi:hypothetical protein